MAFAYRRIASVLLTPLIMLTVAIAVHSVLPSDNLFLFAIRLFTGVFALLYIPGHCLVTCFLEKSAFKNFISYLIFGFLYQLFNIFTIWLVGMFFKPLNFTALVYLLTLLFVSTLTLYAYKVKDQSLSLKDLRNYLGESDYILLVILALFLVVSLYYQQFSPSPHSDGAAYLDFARNVVCEGVFSSNMVMPSWSYQNVEWVAGFHSYIFGISAIALFFMLGNTSLLSAKIMLIFTGSLLIFLAYHICRELLDQGTARIAAFLIAISPIFLTHVSLVGGPEITSLLFVLLFMYLTLLSFKHADSVLLPLLAGISLFVSWYAWRFNFVVAFLGLTPSLFVYLSTKYKELNFRNLLLFGILWVSFLIEYRFTLNLTLTLAGVSFPTAILVAAFIAGKLRKNAIIKVFLVIILATYALLFIRHTSSMAIMPLIEQAFIASDLYSANVEVTLGFFNRMLDMNMVTQYSRTYWDGLSSALAQVTIFLGIASLIRFRRIKEILLLCSFPFFHWLIWSLMVTSCYQPRYVVPASVFWIMLAASSITLFMSTVAKLKPTQNCKILLKFEKIKRSVNLSSATKFVAYTILFINLMLFWHPIYDNMRVNILEGWNFSSRFGWDPAIQWIKENTQLEDIMMARHGNYWAWFTDRKTVMFTPAIFGSVNTTQLISFIREFKVKYLIVDYRFYSEFPELRGLYSSPDSFYGSQIAFSSTNEQGYKTIIYNVTNISYGNLVRYETTIANCDSNQYWSTFALYGNGTITADDTDKVEGNSSIKTIFTVKEQKDLTPSAVITYSPTQPLNLSTVSFLQFWIKAPFTHQDINVKLATDSNNYIVLQTQAIQSQTWEQITISLTNNVVSTLGEPNLQSISFIQIYIRGLEPNTTYIYWLDNISAYDEQYVLNGQK